VGDSGTSSSKNSGSSEFTTRILAGQAPDPVSVRTQKSPTIPLALLAIMGPSATEVTTLGASNRSTARHTRNAIFKALRIGAFPTSGRGVEHWASHLDVRTAPRQESARSRRCGIRAFRFDTLAGSVNSGGIVHEEVWHVDPYGHHEARWISDGTPTDLVRDGGIVSKDPPPEAAYSGALQPLPDALPPVGSDPPAPEEAETETIRQRQGRSLSRLFDEIGWPGSNGPGI
jgi:hypothetical protein